MKPVVSFSFILLLFMSLASPVHAKLWINEFSSDNGTDWVELYNDSEIDVVPLSAYQLKDNSSSGNVLTLSGLLSPKGFVTFEWGSSLNKNGDTIRLIDTVNSGEEVDKISYGDVEGKTITSPASGQYGGRLSDGGTDIVLFTTHSKGATNASVTLAPTATPILTDTPKPTPTPTRTPTPGKSPTPTKVPTQAAGKSSTPEVSRNSLPVSVRTNTSLRPSPTVDHNAPTAVLAAKSDKQWPTIKPTQPETEVKTLGVASFNLSYILISLGGVIVLLGSGYAYLRQRRNQ